MSRQPAPPPGGSRKISFNVSDQYDIQDVVGEGAYGVVWYGSCDTCNTIANPSLTKKQLGAPQAFRTEGRYQENHTVRSFYVLSANVARNEAASVLQP